MSNLDAHVKVIMHQAKSSTGYYSLICFVNIYIHILLNAGIISLLEVQISYLIYVDKSIR